MHYQENPPKQLCETQIRAQCLWDHICEHLAKACQKYLCQWEAFHQNSSLICTFEHYRKLKGTMICQVLLIHVCGSMFHTFLLDIRAQANRLSTILHKLSTIFK